MLDYFLENLWSNYGEGKKYAYVIEATVPPMSLSNYDVDVSGNPEEQEVNIAANQGAITYKLLQLDGKRIVPVDEDYQINEARQGSLREIIKKILPSWPDYVIKDWISTRVKDQEDLRNLQGWLGELNKMVKPNSWKLHQPMFLTFDMLAPKTRYFMKTKRQFGARNPFMVPRDAERSENAEQLVKTKGMENLPPVIMLQHPNGLELSEGWHRTMAAFRLHPEGFYINAWVGQAGDEQQMQEAWEQFKST
jgi:hypothetical protein